MSDDLRQLLAEAGVGNGRPPEWSRVVVVSNAGGVPPPCGEFDPRLTYLGFHIIVLDPEGRPSHFCKCRPAGNGLHRETAIMQVLGELRELEPIVPRTRGAAGRVLQVQASTFVSGEGLGVVYPRLSEPASLEALRRLCRVAARLSGAANAVPGLTPPSASVELDGQLMAPIRELADVLGRERVRALDSASRDAGSVPGQAQHGDFWPANIVHHGDSYSVVDFEFYGLIRVPLYDVFHLLRTVSNLRDQPRGEPVPTWLERMMTPGTFAFACRPILQEQIRESGLNGMQASAALLYYLTHVAASIRGRGVPEAFWGPYTAETMQLADRLIEGGGLPSLAPILNSGSGHL